MQTGHQVDQAPPCTLLLSLPWPFDCLGFWLFAAALTLPPLSYILRPSFLPANPHPLPAVPAGYIVVLDYKGYANGQLFEDTTARGKPIVFLYGKRPFSGGMCLGVEKALATMRVGEGGEGGSQGVLLLLRSDCCCCCGPAAAAAPVLLHGWNSCHCTPRWIC